MNIQKRRALFLGTALAVFVFVGALGQLIFLSRGDTTDSSVGLPQTGAAAATEPVVYTDARTPVRIVIPRASVDARVEQVGVSAKGNIAVPSSFQTVGWYMYGALPGNDGVAIFDGHVDNALGMPGVFADLEYATSGSEIRVVDEGGVERLFLVESVQIVPYDHPGASSFFTAPDETPRIVLITCGGKWIQKLKTYSERLIVTARLKT